MGLLLTPLAPLFPERAQGPGLYGGIALSLVCTAALVAYLAKDTQLEWRGISPVVGILIGALSFTAPLGWHYFADRHTGVSRTLAVSALTPRGAALTPTSAGISQLPVPQAQQMLHSSSRQQADPLLAEVSAVLAEKARPALRATSQAISVVVRAKDPGLMNSQFAAAATGLADVQASLERIRSENPSRGEQLDAVLGDTTPLTELIAKLERYSGAPGSEELTREPESLDMVRALRGDVTDVSRWVAGCEQGIASLRAGGATQ